MICPPLAPDGLSRPMTAHALRVSTLTTGAVRPKRRTSGPRRYLPGGWSDRTWPVNAFVVEHPDGVCLFDAGQTARATRPGYHPRWHPFLRLARFELTPGVEAAMQLGRLGIAPADVRWVVLSHLHTDHVGGIGAFAHAEVLVSRAEWEHGSGVAGRLRGYVPQHWPRGLVPRLVDFDGPALGPFSGSLDLLGDGALRLVPTPGHTPGHASLLVGGTAPRLLAGDLVRDPADLARVDPRIHAFCRERGIEVLTAHHLAPQ